MKTKEIKQEFERWIEHDRPNIWFKYCDLQWIKTDVPYWSSYTAYIVDDCHAELRKLQHDNQETEFEVYIADRWMEAKVPAWDIDTKYRVKEPTFKVGDYVKYKLSDKTELIKDADLYSNKYWELWKPQHKELVYCWDNGYMSIRELRVWNESGTYKYDGVKNNTKWENCIPVLNKETWMQELIDNCEDEIV